MSHQPTAIEELERRVGAEWTNIAQARRRAQEKREELHKALAGLDSTDTSIVVFGSLAREEWTSGSDLDWTFLIDGQANPEHTDSSHKILLVLKDLGMKLPGREGVFGNLTFSHELVHLIGGQDDTNRNTTRRILLLLESQSLGNPEAYERVVKSILKRYLLEDRGLWHGSIPHKVPRFLLNDIARYWRTMAVDFAYKQRERAGEGWALRNVKLRMSRKLIFVSGLLTCFTFQLDMSPEERKAIFDVAGNFSPLVNHLHGFIQGTPLEILANALLRYKHMDDASKSLFDAYDQFLELLDNASKRKKLEELTEDQLGSNPTFRHARELSHQFQDSLKKLFLENNTELYELTLAYGVF